MRISQGNVEALFNAFGDVGFVTLAGDQRGACIGMLSNTAAILARFTLNGTHFAAVPGATLSMQFALMPCFSVRQIASYERHADDAREALRVQGVLEMCMSPVGRPTTLPGAQRARAHGWWAAVTAIRSQWLVDHVIYNDGFAGAV